MSKLRVNEISHKTGTGEIVVPTGNKIVGTDVGSVVAPGMVLQAVYATSGFVNQAITSTTPVALTGMTATITPKFANSRILVQAMISASWTYVSSVHVFRDGVDVITAHGGNSQSGGTTALWTHYGETLGTTGNNIFPFPVIYAETPNSTSELTYSIRANSGWSGASNTFYLNNRGTQDMLSCSTMVVMEIAQ